jgi:two-component system cell cycle sensor histidine kinase/response regulator CckA
MTAGTISGDILLLLSNPEAGRLLADMLSRGHRVLVADGEASLSGRFALGVVDGPALNRGWRAIAERKRAESPAFLPFLLVTMPQDVPLFARFLWTAVDELIQMPIQTPELLARVDVLLRARDASLRALDPSLARFRAAFDNDLVARWIASPDGRLLVANERFGALLGLDSPEDARRRIWGDFIPDTEARRGFLEQLAAAVPIERTMVELRTQRGRQFTAAISAVAYVQAGATEIHGIVGEVAAATSRVQRELLSERLGSVAKLAGGIAHNVNNALGTMLGCADLLLSDLALDDPRRAEVEEIRHAAIQSAELTQQLLAFSRRQVLRPTGLHLADVARSLERTLRGVLREDVALTLSDNGNTVPVLADRSQLERVLLNLVLNARDASVGLPNAEVRVETGSTQLAEPDDSRIGFEIPAGEYAVLVVRDNGRGMSPDVCDRAFEPFFTTKRGDALGLGLSTVYGIVKQSGGFVWLESEPRQGTTATIYLPAAAQRLKRSAAEEVAAPAPTDLVDERAAVQTVLLAECEDSVRAMAARILRQKGYAVLEAPDGAAAVEAMRVYGGPLDLILTDVAMPELDGAELASRASELRPGVPMLFLSADEEAVAAERGARGGLLSKPFRAGELVAAVRKAIAIPKPAGA